MLVVCCLTCTAPEDKLALAKGGAHMTSSAAAHKTFKGDAEGKVGDKRDPSQPAIRLQPP